MNATATAIRPSKTAKPTPRQVYFICRLALRFAGHELPDSRAGADELIRTLQSALADGPASEASASDDIPF